MKLVWVQVIPFQKELAIAALESGADALFVEEGVTPKVKELGVMKTVAPDGDIKPGQDVEIVEVKAQPTRDGADLSLQVVWAARGEVDHWGHRHSRRNLYEAIVDLGLVESAWKIVGLETLEERRIEPFGPVAQAAEIEN